MDKKQIRVLWDSMRTQLNLDYSRKPKKIAMSKNSWGNCEYANNFKSGDIFMSFPPQKGAPPPWLSNRNSGHMELSKSIHCRYAIWGLSRLIFASVS